MTYEEAIYYAKGMKEADSSEPFSTFIDMAIDALEKVKKSEEAFEWCTDQGNERYYKDKLDKIYSIVRFEVGNRHEIEEKVLKVINNEDKD